MKYRPDIDGLRAIAILSVVLYHLGFKALGGGYLGVDVFFVISGFLITNIINREMDQNRFSLIGFYERRIRRIFPALFCVLFLSSLTAVILLFPKDLVRFSQNLIAALAFVSNIWFWRHYGYFGPASNMNPLLHTWSLAVEEQFYIGFPVLMLIVRRFFPQRTKHIFIGLALTSFLIGAAILPARQLAVFYLPIFRAWQLLLGGILALSAPSLPKSRWVREILTALGLAMIAFAVFAYSNKVSDIGTIGLKGLIPCCGAALLILGGTSGETFSSRLLGAPPMVLVGLISYSLYLWHWPLIVFTRYWLARDLKTVESLVLLVLTLALAFLSWRYIERPFRKSGIPRKKVFAGAAAITAVLLIIGMAIYYTQGFPNRFNPEVLALIQEDPSKIPFLSCSNLKPDKLKAAEFCEVGDRRQSDATFLIWGDSHSLALLPALDSVLSLKKLKGVYAGRDGCPPLIGIEHHSRANLKGSCREFNGAVKILLAHRKDLSQIVLIAAWSQYANDTNGIVISNSQGIPSGMHAFPDALKATFEMLSRRDSRIWVVGEVPEIGWDVPFVMGRSSVSGRPLPPAPDLRTYRDANDRFNRVLAGLKEFYSIQELDMGPVFCSPQGECRIEINGMPLYLDDNHLNLAGARYTIPFFLKALDSIQIAP